MILKIQEHNNNTSLTAITRELDDLWQRVNAGEGQASEASNHIEHKPQRLTQTISTT